nr:MAG TPA: hypothetical protein [Caudoviricetes sp.]
MSIGDKANGHAFAAQKLRQYWRPGNTEKAQPKSAGEHQATTPAASCTSPNT